jgi:hypothetical protein
MRSTTPQLQLSRIQGSPPSGISKLPGVLVFRSMNYRKKAFPPVLWKISGQPHQKTARVMVRMTAFISGGQ